MKHSLRRRRVFLLCIISQIQCAHGVTLKSLMFLRMLCDCSSFAWWAWWWERVAFGQSWEDLTPGHLSLIGRWPFRCLGERSNIRVRGWRERLAQRLILSRGTWVLKRGVAYVLPSSHRRKSVVDWLSSPASGHAQPWLQEVFINLPLCSHSCISISLEWPSIVANRG